MITLPFGGPSVEAYGRAGSAEVLPLVRHSPEAKVSADSRRIRGCRGSGPAELLDRTAFIA